MTRVLVVDDCQEITDVVKELLEQQGYCVEMAHDSRTALGVMEGGGFDVVLCDLVLPLDADEQGHDGMESDSAMVGMHCIHELAKRHPKVPVIAMSGELVGAPLSVVENFGAKATLSKPFNRAQLLDAVKNALGRQ